MNTSTNNIQTKNAASVYLDKNDPIFITIKGRVVTDMKQRLDTASTENKLIAAQMKTWTTEKQNQMDTLLKNQLPIIRNRRISMLEPLCGILMNWERRMRK